MAFLPVENQKVKTSFIKGCQGDSVCNQAAVEGYLLPAGQGVSMEPEMAVQSVCRLCGP